MTISMPPLDVSMIPLRLRHGTCQVLEDEATRLIMESLEGVTSRAAKADILTPWKEEDRKNREVLTSTGFADPAVRRGMFHRAWNPREPHLNSREGHYRARRMPALSENGTGDGEYADDGE